MGGLASSRAGGLTSGGWALSSAEQPVQRPLLGWVGGSQGRMILSNRFLEHLLRALWVKNIPCVFSVGLLLADVCRADRLMFLI